jgi:hypothetical protein
MDRETAKRTPSMHRCMDPQALRRPLALGGLLLLQLEGLSGFLALNASSARGRPDDVGNNIAITQHGDSEPG